MGFKRKKAYRWARCYCQATFRTNAPNDPYCSDLCRLRVKRLKAQQAAEAARLGSQEARLG